MSAAPTPKAAVFLSYAAASDFPVIDIAGRISRSGISVFLSQACNREDWERHVHNAVSLANEVLLLMTPLRKDLLQPDAAPVFLSGHLVWLAIGSAWARGVPIKGLLKGIDREDLIYQPAIPRSIRQGPLFESVDEWEADLLGGLPEKPPKPSREDGLACKVCICYGRGAPPVPKLSEELLSVGFKAEELLSGGFGWEVWRPNLDYDAAILIPGSTPGEDWKRFASVLVRDFRNSKKPVALLTLPGIAEQPELAGLLPATARVEYHESDISTFLRIVWTLVGYQQIDLGTTTFRDISVPLEPEDELAIEALPLVPSEASKEAAGGGSAKGQSPKQRSGVFVSYCHEDKSWLEILLVHLAPFEQLKRNVWTDQEIKPGAKWHEEIQNRLDTAQVAVLLVSPSYLNSPYIRSEELPTMLAASNSEGLVIFWIPVIASGVKQTRIAQFQAAHDPARPLRGLDSPHRDEAWVQIMTKLAESVAGESG